MTRINDVAKIMYDQMTQMGQQPTINDIARALADAGHLLPDPIIIRTVEELEVFDGETIIGSKDGYITSATELRLFVRPHNANKYLPAVVITPADQVRACREALEGGAG